MKQVPKKKYEVSMDVINKTLRSISAGKFWKPQEGKNKIRILPPTDGSGLFYKQLSQHYGFKDENNQRRAHPCLEMMEQKPCPVCKLWKALEASGDKETARELRPSTQFMVNIFDRSGATFNIWAINPKMMRGVLTYLNDEDYGPEILDPDTGRDFTIVCSGQGLQRRYNDPIISPKETSIGVEDWEDRVHNLDAEIQRKTYGELVHLLESQYGDHLEELGIKFKRKKKVVESEEEAA